MSKKVGTNFNPTLGQKDRLRETCEVIYERHRRQKLEKKFFKLVVFLISIILSIGTILIISFVNYDMVFAIQNKRTSYIDSVTASCDSITYGVIDLISTPMAIVLLLMYIVLYKRRVFLVNKFKYKNIGLPMLVTVWSKSFRFNYAMVYGLIAQNIVEIVISTLGLTQADDDIKAINDPTGLIKLLFTVAQVILVGISEFSF
jgi:hypothetical protein